MGQFLYPNNDYQLRISSRHEKFGKKKLIREVSLRGWRGEGRGSVPDIVQLDVRKRNQNKIKLFTCHNRVSPKSWCTANSHRSSLQRLRHESLLLTNRARWTRNCCRNNMAPFYERESQKSTRWYSSTSKQTRYSSHGLSWVLTPRRLDQIEMKNVNIVILLKFAFHVRHLELEKARSPSWDGPLKQLSLRKRAEKNGGTRGNGSRFYFCSIHFCRNSEEKIRSEKGKNVPLHIESFFWRDNPVLTRMFVVCFTVECRSALGLG